MKTTKRIISALLSACFILSFTLIFSFAADHTMTAPLDLSAASADAGDLETDGYHWDYANSTLTIKDLTITLDNVTASGTAAITLPDKDCKVIIEGTNKISVTDKATSNIIIYGIYCGEGLDVSGSGSLDFEYTGTDSDNEGDFEGIYSDDGECSLSGVTVTATATGPREYCSVFESYDVLTVSGVNIKATGLAALDPDGDLTVTDSTVIADTTDMSERAISIYSYGDMIIKNSTIDVKANGNKAIYAGNGSITIESSDVTATETNASARYPEGIGISADDGNITINNSTVNATGNNFGIMLRARYNTAESKFLGGNISITGSEVTAKSASDGFSGIASMFENYNRTKHLYEDLTAITANIMPITITDETVVQGNAINTNKTYLTIGDVNPSYTGADKDVKGIMIVTFSPDTTKAASVSYNTTTHKYLVSNASQTVVLTKDISSKVVLNGGTLKAGTVLKAGDDILTALGTPTKANNTFAGWFYDAACTKPVKAGDKYARGMVLYAKWTANTSANTNANTVNTGDNTAIGAAAAMTLASLAGIAFVSKKKGE